MPSAISIFVFPLLPYMTTPMPSAQPPFLRGNCRPADAQQFFSQFPLEKRASGFEGAARGLTFIQLAMSGQPPRPTAFAPFLKGDLAACPLLSELTFDFEGALSLVSPIVVLVEIEPDHEDQQKADGDAHGASNRHHISNAQALLPLPFEQ